MKKRSISADKMTMFSRRGFEIFKYLLAMPPLLLAFQNCAEFTPSAYEGSMSAQGYSSPPSYSELYAKVFQPRCLSCHSSGSPDFSSYDALLAGNSVIPLNASESSLYHQVATGLMPTTGGALSATDRKAIYDWIEAGAALDSVSAPPGSPSALSATAISSSQINLSWADNSSDETGFKVERATASDGPFALIATVSANATAYANTGLVGSTTYYYRVSSTNSAGDSSPTTVASAKTQAAATMPPSAPSTLSANVISPNQINLSWADNSSTETGFKIERATASGGPFTLLATTSGNVTSYSSDGLSASTTYYFRVSATNSAGDSTPTSTVSATTLASATYSYIYSKILQPKCLSCHSGAGAKGAYDVSTYTKTLTRVVPGDSAASVLFQRVNNGSMPKGYPFSEQEVNAIKSWIDAGAANN